MDSFLQTHEATVRIVCFFSLFAAVALWEVLAPRRRLTASKSVRWLNNLGLVALNTVVIRVLFPMGTVGVTLFAMNQGWGLLNHWELPFWLATTLAIIVMDLVIWAQHVLFHFVPVLWRLHRVHHADPDYDLTTGARFHTIEIILSLLIKFGVILVLGPPITAVILFEVILNGMAIFNHANARLPLPLDRILRLFVVTPDMHRVHHSVENDELNSNFGFNLSCWDRLFGTYREQPHTGHLDMDIGICSYRTPEEVSWLPGLLILPFRANK